MKVNSAPTASEFEEGPSWLEGGMWTFSPTPTNLSAQKFKTDASSPDQNAVGTWYGLRVLEPVRYFFVPRLDRIEPNIVEGLSTARRLVAEYSTLPPNWDSYGAAGVSHQAVRAANQLLDLLVQTFGQPGLPETIVPVPDGGLQFEWEKSRAALEIEVQDDGTWNALLIPTDRPAVLREHVAWPELREIIAPFLA